MNVHALALALAVLAAAIALYVLAGPVSVAGGLKWLAVALVALVLAVVAR